MFLNSMRGKKKNKSRMRTESHKERREGIMWDDRSTGHAEREMGDGERENNRETQRGT